MGERETVKSDERERDSKKRWGKEKESVKSDGGGERKKGWRERERGIREEKERWLEKRVAFFSKYSL